MKIAMQPACALARPVPGPCPAASTPTLCSFGNSLNEGRAARARLGVRAVGHDRADRHAPELERDRHHSARGERIDDHARQRPLLLARLAVCLLVNAEVHRKGKDKVERVKGSAVRVHGPPIVDLIVLEILNRKGLGKGHHAAVREQNDKVSDERRARKAARECAQDHIARRVVQGKVALSDEEERDGHIVDAVHALGEGVPRAQHLVKVNLPNPERREGDDRHPHIVLERVSLRERQMRLARGRKRNGQQHARHGNNEADGEVVLGSKPDKGARANDDGHQRNPRDGKVEEEALAARLGRVRGEPSGRGGGGAQGGGGGWS